jgi:hypothetical protein
MEGLCIRVQTGSGFEFPGVLESTIHQLISHFWLIDVQAGPFKITDKPNFSELEAEIERDWVAMPELENTSSSLWRPGIFPRFEELFCLDEWTYLTSLRGSEADAVSAAKDLFAAQYLSPRFFELVDSIGATFLLYVDGVWEVYSTNHGLLDELRTRKDVSPIHSDKWQQSECKS